MLLREAIKFWVRWQACKMAASIVAAWTSEPETGVCPMLWSSTVFFETYIWEGAEGTREEFGPTEPVKLEVVDKSDAGHAA